MTLAEYTAHYDTTFISRSLTSSTVDNLIPESRQSDNEENVDLIIKHQYQTVQKSTHKGTEKKENTKNYTICPF